MNVISIILILLIAAAIIFAVRSIWRNKGRCRCCDGSCRGCRICRKG